MTSFVTKDGSLILKNGKLLMGDPSCCCNEGVCCEPLCCNWGVDVFWAPVKDDYEGLVFNEETQIWEPPGGWLPFPDEVPGYTNTTGGGSIPNPPQSLAIYEPTMENCLWDLCNEEAALAHAQAAVQSVDPYAGTKFQADVRIWAFIPAGEANTICGNTPKSTCETIGGTWYDNPEDCSNSCGTGAACCHVSFHWSPAVYDPDTNTFPELPDFDTWVGIPNALIPGWTCSWSFGGYCSKYVPVSSEEECAALAAIPELPFDIDPGYGAGLGFVGAYFSNTPCGACCDRFGCYEEFQGGYCAGTFYPYAKCEDEPCNPLP